MKIGNTTLIPQNIAPSKAQKVGIFDSNDNLVCEVDLGHLKMPNIGEKIYSVGLLSDTHTSPTYKNPPDTANDLTRAISYLSTRAEITCVSGDLVEANDDGLDLHKQIVDANKGDMEMLEMCGNHEHYQASNDKQVILSDELVQYYTGHPLLYSVERHGDVFIMCGGTGFSAMFNQINIQWLYETLEANRNKRCFLFVHPPIDDSEHCGDALNVITFDGIQGYKSVFISLLRHYKNVIYFHGHTHAMLEMQDYLQGLNPPLPANYDFTDGVHSVHIPSGSVCRDISSGSRVDVSATSQGYLMDVYENHIVLRGIDFTKVGTDEDEFIPIAHYCLDTTLKTIEAGTYTDSTGTITT